MTYEHRLALYELNTVSAQSNQNEMQLLMMKLGCYLEHLKCLISQLETVAMLAIIDQSTNRKIIGNEDEE